MLTIKALPLFGGLREQKISSFLDRASLLRNLGMHPSMRTEHDRLARPRCLWVPPTVPS